MGEINSVTINPQNEFTRSLFSIGKDVKSYGNLAGHVANFFNQAVKIGDIFYNRESLAEKVLLDLTNDPMIAAKFKSNAKVQKKINYLYQTHTVNCIQQQVEKNVDLYQIREEYRFMKSDTLTDADRERIKMEELADVYSDENKSGVTDADLLKTLDLLTPTKNKIKTIEWTHGDDFLDKIEDHLQPGDVIFFQNVGKKHGIIDIAIYLGQLFSKVWGKGAREPLAETYTHVAIYIGNGLIAEATPDNGEDVRIISLQDARVKLKYGEGYQYVVSRPQKSFAADAAQVAKKYAEYREGQADVKTNLSYSKSGASKSLFRPSRQSENKTRKRALKKAFETHYKNEPLNRWGKKKQSFFCSFFVMECLQRGEAISLLKKNNIELPEKFEDAQKIFKQLEEKNFEILNEIELNYRAKGVSPLKFRAITEKRSDLFTDVVRIVPPKLKPQTGTNKFRE